MEVVTHLLQDGKMFLDLSPMNDVTRTAAAYGAREVAKEMRIAIKNGILTNQELKAFQVQQQALEMKALEWLGVGEECRCQCGQLQHMKKSSHDDCDSDRWDKFILAFNEFTGKLNKLLEKLESRSARLERLESAGEVEKYTISGNSHLEFASKVINPVISETSHSVWTRRRCWHCHERGHPKAKCPRRMVNGKPADRIAHKQENNQTESTGLNVSSMHSFDLVEKSPVELTVLEENSPKKSSVLTEKCPEKSTICIVNRTLPIVAEKSTCGIENRAQPIVAGRKSTGYNGNRTQGYREGLHVSNVPVDKCPKKLLENELGNENPTELASGKTSAFVEKDYEKSTVLVNKCLDKVPNKVREDRSKTSHNKDKSRKLSLKPLWGEEGCRHDVNRLESKINSSVKENATQEKQAKTDDDKHLDNDPELLWKSLPRPLADVDHQFVNWRAEITTKKGKLEKRTFGPFDAYLTDKPGVFRIVDRKGIYLEAHEDSLTPVYGLKPNPGIDRLRGPNRPPRPT